MWLVRRNCHSSRTSLRSASTISASEILRPHSLGFSSFPLRYDDSAAEYCPHDADSNDELDGGGTSVEVQILTEYGDREVRPDVVRLATTQRSRCAGWLARRTLAGLTWPTRFPDPSPRCRPLLRQKSPINRQYRADDERCFVRCKEQDRLCHLARLAQPSHRMGGSHRR
jgi:hypothetical protein